MTATKKRSSSEATSCLASHAFRYFYGANWFITELKTANCGSNSKPDELQPQSHTLLLKELFQYHKSFEVVTVVLLKI